MLCKIRWIFYLCSMIDHGWHIFSNFSRLLFWLFIYIKYKIKSFIDGHCNILTFHKSYFYYINHCPKVCEQLCFVWQHVKNIIFYEKVQKNYISHQCDANHSQIYHLAALGMWWKVWVAYINCFSAYSTYEPSLIVCQMGNYPNLQKLIKCGKNLI